MSEVSAPVRRKSLSEQLDRMDAILDALAEGLPAAVADAARAGIRDAAREVLRDAMRQSNPPPVAPLPRPRRPRAWDQTNAALRTRWMAVRRRVASLATGVRNRFRTFRAGLSAIASREDRPLPLRRIACASVVAGIVAVVAGLFVPPALVVVGSGMAVACAAALGQVLLWLLLHPASSSAHAAGVPGSMSEAVMPVVAGIPTAPTLPMHG